MTFQAMVDVAVGEDAQAHLAWRCDWLLRRLGGAQLERTTRAGLVGSWHRLDQIQLHTVKGLQPHGATSILGLRIL
jgi:hypothetical protein